MDQSKLKKFAQYARRSLIKQVGSKLNQVLSDESQAGRQHPEAVDKLKKKIAASDKAQVIEQVAYIWFNRFCALRFMDSNEYSRIMVVSPLPGQFQPEILAEAKAGHIDDSIVDEKIRNKIFNLLNATEASRDPQAEAYRLLIVAVCNDYHRIMPYLFERIEDYTELLMPDDLLSGNSILAYTREAMTPDACGSVESIGWLYQFYISEKKDDVFAGLKKNIKITPANIPAATQLFTPHWIVRYLVENSLGRLWMLNNPNSAVIEQMDYYIKPAPAAEGKQQEETDFLKITSPEEIKICDPACGSGHMLTYAYDLLYAIYLDDGRTDPADIPAKILTNNLYGIEIDERASELAAFALTMKAVKGNPLDDGNNRRRFFRNPVKPNICRIEKVEFMDDKLDSYIDFVGEDLFTQDVRETLKQFDEADNFGSLIQPIMNNVVDALRTLEATDVEGQLFLKDTHKRVLKALSQADYLNPKYHVVVANPPYMGSKGMNGSLTKWAKDNYPNSKSDLFSMFIERNLALALKHGAVGMITMQSWMFLSSYEKLRIDLLKQSTILSVAHLGTRAFDSIGGEVVSTTAFVLENTSRSEYKGEYLRLIDGKSEASKERLIKEAINNPDCGWFFRASASDFHKIPGNPISYWLPTPALSVLDKASPLGQLCSPRKGMCTRDNDYFVRLWSEVSQDRIGFNHGNRSEAKLSGKKWFTYQKGGEFRQWYGNHNSVVDWGNDGYKLLNMETLGWPGNSTNHNLEYIFKEAIVWSKITSSIPNFRYSPGGFLYDDASGLCSVKNISDTKSVLAFLCSKVGQYYMGVINPTINIQPGNMSSMPFMESAKRGDVDSIIEISKNDWDSYEISWDFGELPMLSGVFKSANLKDSYLKLRGGWQNRTDRMSFLESENNKIFIHEYGLHTEIVSNVPLKEITLTCNPHYRYGSDKTDEELEMLLLADTMREFISYSVGCMFGRYSLDKEGLILANQGEVIENYLKQIPSPSFAPDNENVIPLINLELEKGKQDDWFKDDISERFKVFLKVTFGTENYDENLRFIEHAIGKDIKKFFLKDFYTDHIKRYKKRPIYWLFSSPKGSFNALIYMHRYRPDTVSVVLNDYLREFRTKLEAKKESYEQTSISASAEPADKTKALKAIEKIKAVLEEVKDYERDTLYPLASQNIEIDLDDGVKHNYPLFGKALKKVTGLS